MSARIVIIGSGAGGAAAAWALTQRGIMCIVLEAGPHYDYLSDYRLDRPDWEVTGFPEKVATSGRQTFGEMQKLSETWQDLRSWNKIRGQKIKGDRRITLGGYKHVVGVGGSTLYFTGEYHRMNQRSMRLKSDFGVGADWPIEYGELEPFYNQVEVQVGTSGAVPDDRRPRMAPYPLPPLPMSYATQVLKDGHAKIGLNFEPNPLAVLSEPYDDRPDCNFCGNCNRGCPRGDKGTADITFLRHAVASGKCEIRANIEVKELETDQNGRIKRAIFINTEGQFDSIEADIFVLAAGAIETPRLLMNSGVALQNGQVGQNFMETLAWTSIGLHPDPIDSHRGHPSDAICWDFNDPDALDDVVGGFRMSPGTAEANLVGPINYAARVVGGWGDEHKRRMKDMFGRAIGLSAFGESLPNPQSYIDLDPTEKDAQGYAKARINSFLPDSELRRLRHMKDTIQRVLKSAGISEFIEESGTYDEFGSSHVFGTCRMGDDPNTSVVDAFGQSHVHPNLWITDASVFPSSGGGESPSLTISALAVRSMGALDLLQ